LLFKYWFALFAKLFVTLKKRLVGKCRKIGDHHWNNLAKSGYKPEIWSTDFLSSLQILHH
jgi:hypothetical protein